MSYATLEEANALLTSTEWVGADDATKQQALDTGTLYIDNDYTCTVADPVDSSLILANVLLADMYVQGILFAPKSGNLKATTVKAGPVTVSETFSNSDQTIDPFAEIKLLLGSVCSANVVLSTIRV